MNICALFVHNANWQLGTPEELSCFTTSPVASSPILPSADLLHLKSPNHLRPSIVSPSEQAFLGPDAASPNLPHNSIALTSVKVFFGPTLGHFCSADIFSEISRESRYWERGVIRDTGLRWCYPYEFSKEDLLRFASLSRNASPPRPGHCFTESTSDLTLFSSMRRSALLYFLLSLYDIGLMSDLLARLKTASIGSGTRWYSDGRRIYDITDSSDLRGSPSKFELYIKGIGYDIVVTFSSLTSLGLEQKHNPDGRRRESFDSVMSLDSFLSDPVVDWNGLLYGYNR